MYTGCPITWCSKLQTEIALSTTEAEYIALSQGLKEVISTMYFLDEVKEILNLHISTPTVHCDIFQDITAILIMVTGIIARLKISLAKIKLFVKNSNLGKHDAEDRMELDELI